MAPPFVFSQDVGDRLRKVTLIEQPLPTIDLTPVTVSSGIGPSGLRQGQRVKVESGGVLPNNFTAAGAHVNIAGGAAGRTMELVETKLDISAGTIGDGLAAFLGSEVNVAGGTVGTAVLVAFGSRLNITGGSVGGTDDSGVRAFDDGEINISGGTVGQYFYVGSGSRASISGGSVAGRLFIVDAGGVVDISGGTIGRSFDALSGSTVNISGGTLGADFDAFTGSEVNLLGMQFILDGIDITGTLSAGVPLAITKRDVTLSGILGDGSPFSFNLNTSGTEFTSIFSPNAVLTVTLLPVAVPEPSTWLLFVLSSCGGVRRFHGILRM